MPVRRSGVRSPSDPQPVERTRDRKVTDAVIEEAAGQDTGCTHDGQPRVVGVRPDPAIGSPTELDSGAGRNPYLQVHRPAKNASL